MMAERFRMLCLVCLAALALAGSPALAQISRNYGELEFQVAPEPKGDSLHGYTEYRVFVRNRSTENTYRVTLKIPGESYSGRGRGALQAITRTVSVGPELVSVVSLFQPAAPDVLGNDIAVYINGREMKDRLPLRPSSGRSMGHYYGRRGRVMYGGPSFGPGGGQPLVLMSQRVNENFFRRPVAMLPGGGGAAGPPGFGGPAPPAPPGGGPPPAAPPARVVPGGKMGPGGFGGGGIGGPAFGTPFNAQFIRADMPVSVWSSHWLGLTRHDGVVVTREDIHELQSGSNETRAVLHALWQYAETGGVLLVLGPGSVAIPQAWNRHAVPKYGLTVHQVGFGQCIIAPDRKSDKWPSERWNVISTAVSSTVMPWQSTRGLYDLNDAFPVVDNLGVPVKGLFALMVVFAIALGPVNLVVLGKKKKRIWMLWTVPVLSALTCLTVFGYMIIAEGWQGHARVGGITFLDETDHRATSLGRAAFYSPLTPGGGLHFSNDTEVQVLGGGEALGTSCSMDWTEGQHLVHGWVTARVPAHFALRTSETRRERLNIRREADGKLSLLNGLGANIKKLTVADEKGRLHVASDIPAGERATLERSNDRIDGEYLKNDAWRMIYKNNEWITGGKSAKALLGPRMYFAVVEGSPFHEQGLHGAAVRNTESIVLGLMAEIEGK